MLGQRRDDRFREKKDRPIIEDFMRRRAQEVGADFLAMKIPVTLTETAVQNINFVGPTPTTGIGFIINELFVRFGSMLASECTIFQFYRFTLAQLELQLFYACERPAGCYPFSDFHFQVNIVQRICFLLRADMRFIRF